MTSNQTWNYVNYGSWVICNRHNRFYNIRLLLLAAQDVEVEGRGGGRNGGVLVSKLFPFFIKPNKSGLYFCVAMI
jgi:hypothetical protein